MHNIFLQTNRLILKYLTMDDFEELRAILQDDDVMYAWEYTFSDNDVRNWINKNLELYEKYNLGYFIIIDKSTDKISGQAALMPDTINDRRYYEISYILKKNCWHKGYATEAASALALYAFNVLDIEEIIFEIRPNNFSSRKVAERLNAKEAGKFTKDARGTKVPHLIYRLDKNALTSNFCKKF